MAAAPAVFRLKCGQVVAQESVDQAGLVSCCSPGQALSRRLNPGQVLCERVLRVRTNEALPWWAAQTLAVSAHRSFVLLSLPLCVSQPYKLCPEPTFWRLAGQADIMTSRWTSHARQDTWAPGSGRDRHTQRLSACLRPALWAHNTHAGSHL